MPTRKSRRPFFLAWLICVLVSVNWGLLSTAPAEQPIRPPIILISIDTLRADRLSCYGYHDKNTRNIDSLVMGGTLFTQVSAQVPLTLPSHVCMLASTYPSTNGVRDNGQPLGPDQVTLAEVMKSNGYRTAAFVGSYVLDWR